MLAEGRDIFQVRKSVVRSKLAYDELFTCHVGPSLKILMKQLPILTNTDVL